MEDTQKMGNRDVNSYENDTPTNIQVKPTNNVLLIVLIVLLVILIGTLVSFYLSLAGSTPFNGETKSKEGITTDNDKNKESNIETNTEIKNDKNPSWKTYNNDELKFSLKYPSDWTQDTLEDGTIRVLPKSDFPGDTNVFVSIKVTTDTNESLTDFMRGLYDKSATPSSNYDTSHMLVRLGELQGIEAYIFASESFETDSWNYLVKVNNNIYQISTTGSSLDSNTYEFDKTESDIINSIQFKQVK